MPYIQKVTRQRIKRLERLLQAVPTLAPRAGAHSHQSAGLDQLGPRVRTAARGRGIKAKPYWWGRRRRKAKPKGPNGEWTEEQTLNYERAKRANMVRRLPGFHGNFGARKGQKGRGNAKITVPKLSITAT